MKRSVFLLGMAVCVVLASCAPRYPVTKVNTIDSRPTLSFTNAPAGSVVVVDGLKSGEAAQYNGKPKVLVVEPGTHDVAVTQNDKVIFQQTVFIESEHKVINVH